MDVSTYRVGVVDGGYIMPRGKGKKGKEGGYMKIKVTYNGNLDKELDSEIRSAIEGIGGEWYAQGFDFTTNIRDICFDYLPDLNNKG